MNTTDWNHRGKYLAGSVLLAMALLGTIGIGLARARTRMLEPANVFLVTSTSDAGPGSLRQALLDANSQPGSDLIEITASGVVALGSPLPPIIDAVSIAGPGAASFAVDGQNLHRVFDIELVEVTIEQITVQNGNAAGTSASGAGIRSTGDLTLIQVAVLDNTSAGDGGGLFVSGELTVIGGEFRNNVSTGGVGGALRACCQSIISGTRFISNTASGDGGGVIAFGESSLMGTIFQQNRCTQATCDGGALFSFSQTTISAAEFTENTARDQGGAIAAPGNLALSDSIFSQNQAVTGGALYAQDLAEVRGTTFLSNTVSGSGGGIFSFGTLTVTNGTFLGNGGTGAGGGGIYASGDLSVQSSAFISNTAAEGGGLYHTLWDAEVTNTLFVGNSALPDAGSAMHLTAPGAVELLHATVAGPGGRAIEVLSGTVSVLNSILAGHTTAIHNANGTVSQDFNQFFGNGADTQGPMAGGASSFAADPQFRGAGDFRLAETSPAINAATDAGVVVDFEGEPRPQDSGFDIGFDEASYISGLSISYSPTPAVVGGSTTFTATLTSGAGAAFTWNFGDGSATQGGNPLGHVFSTAGLYTVVVTATNSLGSAYTSNHVGVVAAPPAPNWLYVPFIAR